MMYSRKLFFFSIFSLLCFLPGYNLANGGAVAPDSGRTTLHDAVSYTVASNPGVLMQTKIRRASDEGVRAARAGYYPSVDINAGYGREKSRNATTRLIDVATGRVIGTTSRLWRRESGIRVRQMLFDGFFTYNEVGRNKSRTIADAYQVFETAEETALEVVRTYMAVIRDRRLLAIARNNLAAHQRTFNMIKRRAEQGLSRKADINQALGRLSLAHANYLAAQNTVIDSKAQYHRVTGLYADKLASVPMPARSSMPTSEVMALHEAIEFHPGLKSAIADVEEANAQHLASLAPNVPRIEFEFDANSNRDLDGARGPNDDVLGILRLTYNLYNGGADIARQRETAYLSQEASEIRNRTYRQIIENMKLAWNRYTIERQRLPELRTHVFAARKTVNAYRQQFKIGRRTLLDLLDSENEAFNAQIALINGEYAYKFAQYRILTGKGQLLADIGVQLPAEAHVPYKAEYIKHRLPVNPYEVPQVIEPERSGLPYANVDHYDVTETTHVVPRTNSNTNEFINFYRDDNFVSWFNKKVSEKHTNFQPMFDELMWGEGWYHYGWDVAEDSRSHYVIEHKPGVEPHDDEVLHHHSGHIHFFDLFRPNGHLLYRHHESGHSHVDNNGYVHELEAVNTERPTRNDVPYPPDRHSEPATVFDLLDLSGGHHAFAVRKDAHVVSESNRKVNVTNGKSEQARKTVMTSESYPLIDSVKRIEKDVAQAGPKIQKIMPHKAKAPNFFEQLGSAFGLSRLYTPAQHEQPKPLVEETN